MHALDLATSGVALSTVYVPELACDLDGNLTCDASDLNSMFSSGDLVSGVATTVGDAADFNGDSTLNAVDINMWLSHAAAANGFSTAYQPGDTDQIGATSPTVRTVDTTDFHLLASNYDSFGDGDPTNGPFWNQGNFDGDDDIDITDFHALAVNFAPEGYSAMNAIPEPSSVTILVLAAIMAMGWSRKVR